MWSIDEACLFDDLAGLQGLVDGVDRSGMDGDDDKAADDDVQASISGYAAGVGAVPGAGPGYLSLDGQQLDLSIFTISCDITPLVVHKVKYPSEQGQDQDQDQEGDSHKEMDTLHSMLISTNLTLD